MASLRRTTMASRCVWPNYALTAGYNCLIAASWMSQFITGHAWQLLTTRSLPRPAIAACRSKPESAESRCVAMEPSDQRRGNRSDLLLRVRLQSGATGLRFRFFLLAEGNGE